MKTGNTIYMANICTYSMYKEPQKQGKIQDGSYIKNKLGAV